MSCLCITNYQTLQLRIKIPIRARNRTAKSSRISSQLGGDSRPDQPNQQLNLSVLRFTLGNISSVHFFIYNLALPFYRHARFTACLAAGIPGLDESYLPRWLGYGFGSLLVLNHFFGSSDVTSPQLVSKLAKSVIYYIYPCCLLDQ